MTDIVTLVEAKLWCRMIAQDEDETFRILIAAATETVLEQADAWDGTGEPPARLKLAILTRVAESFQARETLPEAKHERMLIQPLRVLDL